MLVHLDGCKGVFWCSKCLKDVEGCPFDYRNSDGEVVGPCCKNKSKGASK